MEPYTCCKSQDHRLCDVGLEVDHNDGLAFPESEHGVVRLLSGFRYGRGRHAESVAVGRDEAFVMGIGACLQDGSVFSGWKQPRRWELNFHRLAVY